jgi:membrane protein implicated in regulation of membrane protease activity
MLRWLYSTSETFDTDDEGVVVDMLSNGREWQIAFQSTYWIARSHRSLALKLGDSVRVIGRRSNTLLIDEF